MVVLSVVICLKILFNLCNGTCSVVEEIHLFVSGSRVPFEFLNVKLLSGIFGIC